ncbi:hypothetical protein MXD63_38835, partial [Frankia sp. Cpl3]|nr:hypothetical protein [Frankia sp. Cpl3]
MGITRAEERLFLTGARVRTLFGRTNSNAPSRFFQEISSDLLDGMTQQAEGYSRYGFGARTAEPRIFSGAGNKGVPGSTGTAFGGASGAAASTGAGSTGSSLGRGTVHQPAKMASHGGGAGIDWKVGEKVKHGRWGIGTVVKVKGADENMELDIAFPSPV